MTELFLELEFQPKGNIHMKKKVNSQQNINVFLGNKRFKNKITGIQILHRKRQNIKLNRMVIVRTGTYLEWEKWRNWLLLSGHQKKGDIRALDKREYLLIITVFDLISAHFPISAQYDNV